MMLKDDNQWWNDKLFPIQPDVLDIVKEIYWRICYGRVIKGMKELWWKRRPYKQLSAVLQGRSVHEGRVFLKNKRVGPLIGSLFKRNYYINGMLLYDNESFEGVRNLSLSFRALFKIIHPRSGVLYDKPSRELRTEIIRYYMENEGELVKYQENM